MGNITLRTSDVEDTEIRTLQALTGEKTASSAIKKAIAVYEYRQQELHRLQSELDQTIRKNRQLCQAIKEFQSAQTALYNLAN